MHPGRDARHALTPPRQDLEALAAKYRTLASLRERREALAGQGKSGFSDEEGEHRRRAFRQVARAYPGALRELDACSADLLRRKAAAVDAALAAGETPPWILVVLRFHEALRRALAVKLWLATRLGRAGRVTADLVDAYRADHPEGEAAADAAFLERHLHPPGGRVLALVWETVGGELDLTPDQIRQAVFGDPEAGLTRP